YGEVVPVVFRTFCSRFAENEALLRTNLDLHCGSVHVLRQGVGSPEDFFVELPNARSSTGFHREFDVGNTQCHVPKFWAWSMTAEFIAPRAGCQDIAIFSRASKFRARETLPDGG